MIREIDLSQDPRHSQAAHFASFADPQAGLCAPVDVAPLVACARREELSLYALCAWTVATAANQIPQLRQRLRGPLRAIEHPQVHPSVTVLTTAETFTHCHLRFQPDHRAFCATASAQLAASRTQPDLPPAPEGDDRIYCTCVPWIAFTQIRHPSAGDPHDSVPRIAWGRIEPSGQMPLSVQVHHALVDGLHLGRFYAAFAAVVDRLR